MNEPKAFEANMAGSSGIKSILSDPLSLATKPPVIFKFASAVSILYLESVISQAIHPSCVGREKESYLSNRILTCVYFVPESYFHWSSILVFHRLGMMGAVCSTDTMEYAGLVRWH